jgi:hypothetical protein
MTAAASRTKLSPRPSNHELQRAAEPRAQGLLERHVQEPRVLELTCAPQRTDIDRAQPAVVDQTRDGG